MPFFRIKPGIQHLKLKHELEEKIAEQRSLEWAKRLQEEKQQQEELEAIRGEGPEDDIEKIEAKLEEQDEVMKEESSESDDEDDDEEEEDIICEDKPRKRNPMIDDEAEEDQKEKDVGKNELQVTEGNGSDGVAASDEDSSEDESLESEVETETKPKKGRILKAFEDSDDEDTAIKPVEVVEKINSNMENEESNPNKDQSQASKKSGVHSDKQNHCISESQGNVNKDINNLLVNNINCLSHDT